MYYSQPLWPITSQHATIAITIRHFELINSVLVSGHGLGTCVGKHAFELLALVGRAHVRALTLFTLAGMAPGCIWAHRPHFTLLALIYRLACNLELCWAGFGQPLEANRPPLWLPCWQLACTNVHKHSGRCVAMSGGPVHTLWPFGLSVYVCVHALLQIFSSLPCDSRGFSVGLQ